MSKKITLEGLDHFKDKENAMIAGKPESTNTATVAHAVGEYFYWKGVLHIVTAAIAVGGTIQTNTNVKPAVLADDVGALKESTNDFQEAISEYKTPVNLFNKNSSLIRNGYKFSRNGDYSTLSGSSVSHPIKIKPNTTYCYKFYISYYGGDANSIVRRCDANGNLILSSPQSKVAINVNNSYGYFSFTDEELQTWEYFCVMFRTSGLNDMIIAEGDTLPAYSAWFEPYYQIKESALPDSLPLPVNMQANPLYGKKAAFTGDSICYGAGAAGGYAKIIGENNNMAIFNSGRTGATLVTGTTVDGVNRGWICNMVSSMPADYDYYIVEGGGNDAAIDLGVQLGSMSSGYTATLDTTTLYGAMETICKTLQTTFLGKKYGFLFPHNCYAETGRWNTEFRPAMKQCLKKWGIPYLDLSEKTAELNNVSALRVYTSNGDGWHPTEEGYRLFYVDKIEAWMKTL